MNNNNREERKSEKGVKGFIIAMTALLVIVAAFTVGFHNGYDQIPSSVSATAFVLIVGALIMLVWYRTQKLSSWNDGK